MVKKLSVFILASLLILVSCGTKEHTSNALKKKEVDYHSLSQEDKEAIKAKKFKVKARHTKTYFYDKFGNVGEKGFLVESVHYDEKGNLIEHDFYTSRGAVERKYLYQYDEKGNLINHSSYDIWKDLRFQKLSEYDQYGNVIFAKEYNEKTKEYDKIEYEYDKDGNLLKEIRYNPDDEILLKTENEYDSLGHLVRTIKYVGEDKISETLEYKINDDGRPTIVKIDIPGSLPKFKYFKYDERGNTIEERMKHYIKRFAFNDDNNLIMEELYDGEENLQTRFQYFYDEKGLLKEKIRYDGMGNPAVFIQYEYEFYE